MKVPRAGWSAAMNTNPGMGTNVVGWRAEPFAPAVTWASDGFAVNTRGGALSRSDTDANPMPRRTGDTTYRVRTRITVPVATTIRCGVYFGKTLPDVWRGPFWAGNTNAGQFLGPAYPVAAGTYVMDELLAVPASYHPEFLYVGPVVFTPIRPDTTGGSDRIDYLELTSTPTAGFVDITCLIDEVAIVHGRSDSVSQPAPSAATIDLTMSPTEPLPPEVDIGATLTVDTTVAGETHRRFTGRITDLDIGWDDAGTDTPNAGVARVMAVSVLADYARAVVGAEPFPQELDGARVGRVFAAAGLTLEECSPGTVGVIPRDIDAQAALEVAHGTADSAGGLVWETAAGGIRYADSEYRRGKAVGLTLDACDILVTPTWVRNLSGLVNEIAMGYGVAPEGKSAPVWYNKNETSQAKWGRYAYSVTTELADTLSASSAAGLILAQNAGPVWLLDALPVDLKGLSDADTTSLLRLDVHALIRVTDMPYTGSAPTEVYAWLEGWRERLTHGGHELELTVSDFCRTAPPPRWNDVPVALTWDAAVGTWDDWSCWGPSGLPPTAA